MLRVATATIALATLGLGGIAAATAPPDTTEPDGTEPAGTEPAGTEPAGTEPAGTEPADTEPADTEPADTEPGDTAAPETTEPTEAAECAIGEEAEPATVHDSEANPAAEIAATAFEIPWSDFEEGSEPEEGREFARATLSIENVSTAEDATFEVNVDHFILQDELGFVSTGSQVRTAGQAEADEDVPAEANLEPGEAIELEVTFEAVQGLAPKALFYRPNDEVLVDVAEC